MRRDAPRFKRAPARAASHFFTCRAVRASHGVARFSTWPRIRGRGETMPATTVLLNTPLAHAAHGHHGFPLGAGGALLLLWIVRALARRRRYGRFGRRGLRYVFARLDTSPSQEKVIRAALDELRTRLVALRGLGRTTREGLGRAVADDAF